MTNAPFSCPPFSGRRMNPSMGLDGDVLSPTFPLEGGYEKGSRRRIADV